MLRIKQRHLQLVSRRFWGIFFGAIIAFAVIVQIGRQAFPLVNDYRHIIAQSLGERLGANVEIGRIGAKWSGLRPELTLDNLAMSSADKQQIFFVKSARAELSLIDSIIQGGLAWRRIQFEEFTTTLEQQADNSWRLQGYVSKNSNTGNPFNFDDPLDIFLFGRRVEINSADIAFKFKNGNTTELFIPTIRLDNDRFFHRMSAELNLNDKESLRLVIEGYGDPRHREKFSASGYLRLKDIPTSDVYHAIAKSDAEQTNAAAADIAQGSESPQEKTDTHTLNLELWFKGSPKAGMTTVGKLDIQGLPAQLENKVDLPEQLSTQITGAWNADAGWFLNLQDLDITWGSKNVPLDSLSLYGLNRKVGVRVNELDIGALSDIFINANRQRDSALTNVIQKLGLTGKLKNVDAILTSKDEGFFSATAYLEGGGANAFKGSPELRNISGYVESTALAGYIDADIEKDFKLNLVKVFDDAFILDQVRGQLAWRVSPEEKMAFLSSSTLTALSGRDAVDGSFAMRIPFNAAVGEPELSLAIHADQTDALNYKNYLPRAVPASLTDWLAAAIVGGNVGDIDVLVYGSVAKEAEVKPIYQIGGRLSDVDFRFDSQWPLMSEVKGQIFIDSGDFSAVVDSAMAGEVVVEKASAALVPATSNSEAIIRVDAQFGGELGAAKSFLMASPLASPMSSFLPFWQLDGGYDAALSLDVPLAFSTDKLDYAVNVQLNTDAIYFSRINMTLADINGQFSYTKQAGLRIPKMTASLWGQKFDIKADTDADYGDIGFTFSGDIDPAALQNWSGRAELVFVDNHLPVRGSLDIPVTEASKLNGITVNLRSDLQDVAIDLPKPLGKTREQVGEFETTITLVDNKVNYLYNHNHAMTVAVQTKDNAKAKVMLAIGEQLGDIDTVLPGSAYVGGAVASADYDEWKVTFDRLFEAEAAMNEGAKPDKDDSELLANMKLAHFTFGDIQIDDLDLFVRGNRDGWTFNGDSRLFKGRVFLPEDKSPMQLDFQYLSLFNEQTVDTEQASASGKQKNSSDGQDQQSALLDFDLSGLEPMKVSIDKLELKGKPWGSWRFDLKPISHGLHFANLQASVRELAIGQVSPADFVWTKTADQHQSTFIGTVDTTNVGDALVAWGQERLLDSKKAHFDMHVSWMAPPDLMTLLTLDGDVLLDIENGSFIRGADAGENPLLRLIALFNFDTLARRLRLDFSDLAAKGFAFDRVYSRMRFEEGTATLAEPLRVDSSSSKMQMAGVVDLVDEKIDAQLVVTLPVAGNLAVAAAFVVGLPAGVGVYVVSKMLGEQVDKASSINYSVSGKWADPKIKVRKIFDDTAAIKAGKTLQSPEQDDGTTESAL